MPRQLATKKNKVKNSFKRNDVGKTSLKSLTYLPVTYLYP